MWRAETVGLPFSELGTRAYGLCVRRRFLNPLLREHTRHGTVSAVKLRWAHGLEKSVFLVSGSAGCWQAGSLRSPEFVQD